jgi:HD superfamily phosphohydrolase
MMNVANDELVVDSKGVYSIENFLTARMFMYWQVYYHKTSALAEHLLVKILDRAKTLVAQGVSLPASENLSYFLEKNKFIKASVEDIYRFTQLDDTDVVQAIKSWSTCEDFVLSYYCTSISKRNLPKTIISSHPFSEELKAEKIDQTNRFFNTQDGALLVDEFQRTLLPYNNKKQPIVLLKKNGEVVDLDQSENQILTSAITQENTKYILSFPRKI